MHYAGAAQLQTYGIAKFCCPGLPHTLQQQVNAHSAELEQM